jgi:hypothetical protein
MRSELGVELSVLMRVVAVSEKFGDASAFLAHCIPISLARGEDVSILSRVIILVILRAIAFIFVIAILINLIILIILIILITFS